MSWVDLQLADLHGDAETCGVCSDLDGREGTADVVLVRRGDVAGEWWALPMCAEHAAGACEP